MVVWDSFIGSFKDIVDVFLVCFWLNIGNFVVIIICYSFEEFEVNCYIISDVVWFRVLYMVVILSCKLKIRNVDKGMYRGGYFGRCFWKEDGLGVKFCSGILVWVYMWGVDIGWWGCEDIGEVGILNSFECSIVVWLGLRYGGLRDVMFVMI